MPKGALEILSRQVITSPGEDVVVIEDYRPVWDSIDLRLGQAYWGTRGPEVFFRGEVPFGATSDGRLSLRAAELVGALIKSIDPSSPEAAERIHLLEFGCGSGFFAKLLLDRLKMVDPALYDRVRYVATDRSSAMVGQVRKQGILEEHGDRVVLAQLDANDLSQAAEQLGCQGLPGLGGYQAIFTNYLLDSLPFLVLAHHGDSLSQLQYRTTVAKGERLPKGIAGSAEDLPDLLANAEESDLRDLVDLHKVISVDCRYVPVAREDIPYCGALPAEPRTTSALVVHNYGAVALLEQAFTFVAPGGFILASDYAFNEDPDHPDEFEYQHYNGSVACPFNFAMLDRHFAAQADVAYHAPEEEYQHLRSRLLAKEPAEALVSAFRSVFHKATWTREDAPVEQARQLAQLSRFEDAKLKFEEGLKHQPYNWNLYSEVAEFLLVQCGDKFKALEVAMAGLSVNNQAPRLWNLAGDCFFTSGELERADECFETAMTIDPNNSLSRLNRIYVLIEKDELEAALSEIAEALVLDEAQSRRDAFLERQAVALDRLAARNAQRETRFINRYRRRMDLPSSAAHH